MPTSRECPRASVILLACDAAGTVCAVQRGGQPCFRSYTPYGSIGAGVGRKNEIGFQGQLLEAGHHAYMLGNGHRRYSPHLMRFVQSDQLSPFSESLANSYSFTVNDPVNFKDPSGRMPSANSLRANKLAIEMQTEHPTPTRRIIYLGDEAYAHYDRTKHGKRLNISTHGSPGSITIDHLKFNAQQTVERLEQANVHLTKGGSIKRIRVLSCFSADGGAGSFAAELANLTGIPTKGYFGGMTVFGPPLRLVTAELGPIGELFEYEFAILVDKSIGFSQIFWPA